MIDRELAVELKARLARPDGLPVVVADRHLVDVARVAGESLAKLHAEQRAGRPGAWDEAIERREAFLRATAGEGPTRFAAVMAPAPAVPHLQARYRRLAGDVAVWAETHNAGRPRKSLSPLERAIGPRPVGQSAAVTDWDVLSERMVRVAVDSTLQRLDRGHDELRPHRSAQNGWMSPWLDKLARNGRLAGIDVDQLGDVAARVAVWRDRHRVDFDHTEPLGAAPPPSADKAEYRRLHAQLDQLAGADRDLDRGAA